MRPETFWVDQTAGQIQQVFRASLPVVMPPRPPREPLPAPSWRFVDERSPDAAVSERGPVRSGIYVMTIRGDANGLNPQVTYHTDWRPLGVERDPKEEVPYTGSGVLTGGPRPAAAGGGLPVSGSGGSRVAAGGWEPGRGGNDCLVEARPLPTPPALALTSTKRKNEEREETGRKVAKTGAASAMLGEEYERGLEAAKAATLIADRASQVSSLGATPTGIDTGGRGGVLGFWPLSQP